MNRLTYGVAPEFLSVAACDELCRVIAPYLQPARVFTSDGRRVESAARRADNMTCPPNTGPAFEKLGAALDAATRCDGRTAEDFQFVRYGVGGGYDGHFDWHSPKTLARPGQVGGQRTWTAMIYLKAPEAGGETVFPLLGLRFKPTPGLLLVWDNLDDARQPNPWAWHEAKNVEAGEKWIVTRWYHEKPVRE